MWRSRLYVVRAILEHWVINREWWRDPVAEPGQPELEFWRVEAAPGQGVPSQVYELRRDPVADTWTICPHLAGTQGRRHLSLPSPGMSLDVSDAVRHAAAQVA